MALEFLKSFIRPLVSDKVMADLRFLHNFHHTINWKRPRDWNEWMSFMTVKADISEWTRLADKYAVREYVAERGCADTLVPLFGVWDSADDVDFDSLPDQFVIKTNGGCGSNIIVTDKSKLDTEKARADLRRWLATKYGVDAGEPQYAGIPPKIIAEKLLTTEGQVFDTDSLIDYKFICVDGQPLACFSYYDRNPGVSFKAQLYDNDWNYLDQDIVDSKWHPKQHKDPVPKPRPKNFDRMLEVAAVLSKGHPEMRVDLYDTEGKVYFGELTMTAQGGRLHSLSDRFQRHVGETINRRIEAGLLHVPLKQK